ncbi:hypothetical protein AB0C01_07955 [Micromonospora sp. NPDC048905]|uniref:hypothetical protein n=1 Tax=Micromonospora sp. NPDC048905 TaxID=3155494 RepID=UPI003404A70E
MAGRWHPEHGHEGFLGVTANQARLVLDVEEGWPTYDAGLEFQGLAMRAMSETPAGEYLPDIPTALNLIWGALTDEMDAPGRGSPEQDAAAVRHMKQAAAEWLAVVDSRVARAAYLDRWLHDECGYQRMAPES